MFWANAFSAGDKAPCSVISSVLPLRTTATDWGGGPFASAGKRLTLRQSAAPRSDRACPRAPSCVIATPDFADMPKKTTWRNTLGISTTPAYSSTSPPDTAGLPLSSHPTTCTQDLSEPRPSLTGLTLHSLIVLSLHGNSKGIVFGFGMMNC